MMKVVQMTLEEELVSAVDRAARKLGKSRSAFARSALKAALAQLRTHDLELRHREGYRHSLGGAARPRRWNAARLRDQPGSPPDGCQGKAGRSHHHPLGCAVERGPVSVA